MTPEDFFSEPLDRDTPKCFPKSNINYKYLKEYLCFIYDKIQIKRRIFEKGEENEHNFIDVVDCPEILLTILNQMKKDKDFIEYVKSWYSLPEFDLRESVSQCLENYLPYSTLEEEHNVFYENYYLRIPLNFEEDYFKWSRNRKLKRIMLKNDI